MAQPEFPVAGHLHVESLAGVSGRLRLEIGDQPFAVIEVHDGEVELHRGDGAADAVARCDSEATIVAIGQGTLNPVCAALRNQLSIRGNSAFAIRVIRGLHGASKS
jgi:putative sterol carrier protein